MKNKHDSTLFFSALVSPLTTRMIIRKKVFLWLIVQAKLNEDHTPGGYRVWIADKLFVMNTDVATVLVF